jgi:hypothetical protein
MSDTPETDANIDPHLYNFVRAKFARKLERERDEAREQLRKASVEANTLATSIQKAEYPDAKEFELLGSVAGVISQINNMYAGVRQQRDEARKAFVIATDQMVIAQGNVREANKERDEARRIITSALASLPVGYIPAHTADTIPSRIADLCKAISELERERDEVREAFLEMWQSGDAFLPHVDAETISRWRKAAGWEGLE